MLSIACSPVLNHNKPSLQAIKATIIMLSIAYSPVAIITMKPCLEPLKAKIYRETHTCRYIHPPKEDGRFIFKSVRVRIGAISAALGN